MIPRFGPTPDPARRYTLRPGAYAILPGAQGLLLTHQAVPDPEVQLPGGGIDPGESPTQALVREVYEETGWRVTRPVRLGAYRQFAYLPEYDQWAEKLCHIYVAQPVLRYGPAPEPHHTAEWVAPAAVPMALSNAGDRHFVEQYLALRGVF